MEVDDFDLEEDDTVFSFGGFHRKNFDVLKKTRWAKRRHSDICKYIFLLSLKIL